MIILQIVDEQDHLLKTVFHKPAKGNSGRSYATLLNTVKTAWTKKKYSCCFRCGHLTYLNCLWSLAQTNDIHGIESNPTETR